MGMIDDILEKFGVPRPKPAAAVPATPPVTYRVGGSWGDAIEWRDAENGLVVGWKRRIPREGDILLAPMKSGKTGRYVFQSIKRPSGMDPPDMFFGLVEFIGYEDEVSP